MLNPTFSILIVSKNRKADLAKTLQILATVIDKSQTEVLVFLDGCTDNSESLVQELDWVRWFVSNKSIGASAARHQIYPLANAEILVGLDDDAHPITENFLTLIQKNFKENPNVGILAFEEVKGVFVSDQAAIAQSEKEHKQFLCSEFIGCGFAIRKSVYKATRGFPTWIDIYGEESCVAIEVLEQGFDILYTNQIKVNHRVDIEKRKSNKQNYFRFGKQLKNTTYYFLVYYPFPLVSILKLYLHNFRKYALLDWEYFKIFMKTVFTVICNFSKVLRFRKPVAEQKIEKMRTLGNLRY